MRGSAAVFCSAHMAGSMSVIAMFQQLRACQRVQATVIQVQFERSEHVLIVLSEQGGCPIPPVKPSEKPRRRLTENPIEQIEQFGK